MLKNTLTQDMDRIRRTLEEIDPKAFDRAIEKICSARRIYILGAMSSSILARFLDYNFQLIFDNVHFGTGYQYKRYLSADYTYEQRGRIL